MVENIRLSAQTCIIAAKGIGFTEKRLDKIVAYLRTSNDIEKHEMVTSLKAKLKNAFNQKDAEEYCKQIDSVLSPSMDN